MKEGRKDKKKILGREKQETRRARGKGKEGKRESREVRLRGKLR